MKYLPIDPELRRKLDAARKRFPLKLGVAEGDMVLRSAAKGNVLVAYAAGLVMRDDGSGEYQHVFTCHRGGAVVIPFDPVSKKVGLMAINRPVVPPGSVDAYKSAWDAHIERDDPLHSAFGAELFPLLGMDTYQFPQGYGEAGETDEANALRVLNVQGGFEVADELKLLDGYVVIDPGNRVSPVPFYLAHVDPLSRATDRPLSQIVWVDEREYFEVCKKRFVISDFTRSGYSLLKENRIW